MKRINDNLRLHKPQLPKLDARTIIDAFCLEKSAKSPNDKVFPNTYLNRHEADIFLVTKSGYLYEYEVKISRADFFADFKKRGKHEKIQSGERANTFNYIVPAGLIKPEEVPDYAGLYEIVGFRVANVNKPGDWYDKPSWEEPRISLSCVKAGMNLSKEKLGKIHLSKLYESTYYRYHAGLRSRYKISSNT